jgi:hypothetical protein
MTIRSVAMIKCQSLIKSNSMTASRFVPPRRVCADYSTLTFATVLPSSSTRVRSISNRNQKSNTVVAVATVDVSYRQTDHTTVTMVVLSSLITYSKPFSTTLTSNKPNATDSSDKLDY